MWRRARWPRRAQAFAMSNTPANAMPHAPANATSRAPANAMPRSRRVSTTAGYKGFGSFHSENVEVLVDRACAPDWSAPPAPPAIAAAAAARSKPAPAFGRAMRPEFLLDDAWTFVNHGAFGAPCRAGFEAAAAWRARAEAQPLRFLDRELFPHLVASLRATADLISASPRDVVLAPNATAALNAAIPAAAAATDLGPGDAILLLDVGYGSVAKLAASVAETRGADVVVASVSFPLEDGAAEAAVREALESNRVKVAVFDHVTSNTALRLNVRSLAALCRDRGAAVVVDGAHSLGAFDDLDVPALGADYFCGNLHKW